MLTSSNKHISRIIMILAARVTILALSGCIVRQRLHCNTTVTITPSPAHYHVVAVVLSSLQHDKATAAGRVTNSLGAMVSRRYLDNVWL
jgi:hypothetical protein